MTPLVLRAAFTLFAGIGGQVHAQNHEPMLFIGVNTAPGNVLQRQEIRQSWMQSPYVRGPNPGVVVKFVVGHAERDSEDAKLLATDMAAHDDFLQLPIPEGYHNLVNKTIELFQWFAWHGNARYAMKLDDDSYPNLNRLIPLLELKTQNKKRNTYAGDMMMQNKPLLWGKWRQDPAVYNETYYPPYASGPGYLLGADLIRTMFKDHFKAHVHYVLDNEDANVGVWVHRENVTGLDIDYTNLDAEEEGCRPGVYLAMNMASGNMDCMHQRQRAREPDFCCDHHLSTWADRNALGLVRQARRSARHPMCPPGWSVEQDRQFAWRIATQSLVNFQES
eukprot:CAMPEP_0170623416 /NCGR_PEP_ID=MMETSP0224-20130122/29687_1 /TAXON_ID=285029 /ORGANISM="Togula jolla, Strain CCCM 725" /LENGTH=333 /DNA_ID=CAMNT_0010949869 /DNA_START=67 /DNA_END=1068 /DNA_ORIENTATION=+